MTFEFKGDASRRFENGVPQESLSYKLDSGKKPKQIDLFSAKGRKTGKPLLGIYHLEGNRLHLSWSKIDGKYRPQEFMLEKPNKTRQISLVLERVK